MSRLWNEEKQMKLASVILKVDDGSEDDQILCRSEQV